MIERRCPDCGAKITTQRCIACATACAAKFPADPAVSVVRRPRKRSWAAAETRRLRQVARTLSIYVFVANAREGLTTQDVARRFETYNYRTVQRDLYMLAELGLVFRRDRLNSEHLAVWYAAPIDGEDFKTDAARQPGVSGVA